MKTSVCFKIDCGDLVRIARDRLLEEGYEEARRLLTVAFPDMSIDLVEALLRGEKNLQGVNSCDVVDQDPQDEDLVQYLEQSKYQFCGLVRWDKSWWKPYATVDAYGPRDVPCSDTPRNHHLPWPPTVCPANDARRSKVWSAYRVLWYANNVQDDVFVCDGEQTILFERVTASVPPWVATHNVRRQYTKEVSGSVFFNTPEEKAFLAAYVAYTDNAGILDKRGYLYTEESTYSQPSMRVIAKVKTVDVPEMTADEYDAATARARQAMAKVIRNEPQADGGLYGDLLSAQIAAGQDPEKAAGTIASILGHMVPKIEGEVGDSRYGVITPDGVYWPCKFHAHDRLIMRLVDENYPEAVLGDGDQVAWADDHGFIKVHGNPTDADAVMLHGRFNSKTEATARAYWKAWWPNDPYPERFSLWGG